jgi:nucleotide-binding universal stress UspA family protein
MFKRILVPLDGSELAEKALQQALSLCPESGEIVLLQVIRLPLPVMTPDVGMTMPVIDMDDMFDEAMAYLNGWVEELADKGVQASAAVVEGDNVADTIADYAKEHDIALIVQSTHGRGGFSRLVFGSVAEGVLRQAPCPVMFIRANTDD